MKKVIFDTKNQSCIQFNRNLLIILVFQFQARLQRRQTSFGGFRRDYFIFQWMISFKTWRYIRRTNFKWAPPIDAKNNYVSCANQLLSNEKHSYSNLNSKFILKFSLKIYHLFIFYLLNLKFLVTKKKYEKIKPINKKDKFLH